MGNTALKKHFATAEKTGVLNISSSKLVEWPPDLNRLQGKLRNLDVSNNKLRAIPGSIGQFLQLKSLSADSNLLSEIPNEIALLIRLETLSLSNNKITRIPKALSKLINLKNVNLSGNELSSFPVALCNLKHLDVLDLSRNKIHEVPDQVGELYAAELNMNQNQVSVLSKSIAHCPRLKTLRLQENCLHLGEFPKELFSDSKVTMMTVEGNLFEMKQFMDLEGYEEYMQRYTEVKKKLY